MSKIKFFLLFFVLTTIIIITAIIYKNFLEENSEFVFSKLSSTQKNDYLENYLKDKYDFEFTYYDVKPKQVSFLENEDYYYSVVETSNGDVFTVWIAEDGNIIDSLFMKENENRFLEYFNQLIHNIVPDSKVYVYSKLADMPSYKLMEKDDLGTYLKNQPVISDIRIVADANLIVNDNLIDNLKTSLMGFEANVYIYLYENIDSINFGYSDYENYNFKFFLKKNER